MKNQKGFTLIEIITVISVVVLLLLAGGFVYKHKQENKTKAPDTIASCEPTQAMIKSQDYDVPCSLMVLLSGPPYASESTFESTVKPINGEINPIDPEDGIYGVKVKAGTDNQSIQFLEKQSIVQSVTHDHCCEEANDNTRGAQ